MQRTAPQVHFLAVLQCRVGAETEIQPLQADRNAALVDYERSFSVYIKRGALYYFFLFILIFLYFALITKYVKILSFPLQKLLQMPLWKHSDTICLQQISA